jgi:hypothetical protein
MVFWGMVKSTAGQLLSRKGHGWLLPAIIVGIRFWKRESSFWSREA